MSLRNLNKYEKRIVLLLVEEVLCGQYLSDVSYRHRVGLKRATAHTLLNNWPHLDETNIDVRMLLNNSMNEMCHGIRFDMGWPWHLPFTQESARSIFHKWKRSR